MPDVHGIANFHLLQQDLSQHRADRLVYFVFDLLYLDGFDLRQSPLLQRKRALSTLLSGIKTQRIRLSPRRIASLYLGRWEDGKLLYSGKAQTGFKQAHRYSRELAQKLAASNPARYTTSAVMSERPGHLFMDFLRNGRGTTAVGTNSPRARPGFPIAAPVSWRELEGGMRPDTFTMAEPFPTKRKGSSRAAGNRNWRRTAEFSELVLRGVKHDRRQKPARKPG